MTCSQGIFPKSNHVTSFQKAEKENLKVLETVKKGQE